VQPVARVQRSNFGSRMKREVHAPEQQKFRKALALKPRHLSGFDVKINYIALPTWGSDAVRTSGFASRMDLSWIQIVSG
jgi:hypothetical protein